MATEQSGRSQHVVPGALWRCRRRGETHRTLLVCDYDRERDRVFVIRNTSRRTQSLKLQSLLRDYAFERMEAAL